MHTMRRFAFFALVFFVFFAAALASFQTAFADGLSGPIVPACQEVNAYGTPFSGACQLCDLVKLARQLVSFAVAFSVIVATLMFTYAGVLYFTAAAKDNIKKAHGIFVKVLVGLVIILAAWMVIDIIMRTLVGENISWQNMGPWNSFTCEAYPTSDNLQTADLPTPVSDRGDPGAGTGVTGITPEQERAARQQLVTDAASAGGNICVSASGYAGCTPPICTASVTQGCTNVGGLTPAAHQNIVNIAQHYNGALNITGGTEGGHALDSQHNLGQAVDFRWDPALARLLRDSYDNGNPYHIQQICTVPSDAAYQIPGHECTETVRQIHVGFGG